ncbi:MAG: protein kinase [Candidatus Anammoximicrobium sp.]|nr:protein kinase [Candidatus Anammoximicrobium sp.]
MSELFRCVCGHSWQPTGAESGAAATRPVFCPRCGALLDTGSSQAAPDDAGNLKTTEDSGPGSSSPATLGGLPSLAGYRIERELGRGGMGVVYRAFSTKLNRVVALKTLQRIDPVPLQRFKQEFRALADVDHPGLITLYELISDGETWFFSMELVEGVDFVQYVRSGPVGAEPDTENAAAAPALTPLQLIRLRRGLAQLVAAVAALHRAGLLHRDIKPSNILVTADEHLVLLDLGLAAELGGDEGYLSSDANLVGTVAYMSPEQASVEEITQASDWYCVGAVLYEALTGRLPFSGHRLKVLMAKSQQDPPPPASLVPDLPEDLNQLCVDLLQRNPSARPSSEEILRRLTALPADSSPHAAEAAGGAEKPPFVGRGQHLAHLEACYRELERGQATVVFVHGYSGIGKSALLQEFTDRVRRVNSTVVLAGRCYEQESVPFKALDSLIDSLSNHLRKLSRAEADALMPRDVQTLTRVFPVLGRVEAVCAAPRRPVEGQDQQALRRRAVSSLRELLTRLGDRHPLVLVIDDLQWGDEDSAVMLCELLRPPDAPLLMLAGAYRAEDALASPFLRAFRETERRGLQRLKLREVEVGPLSKSDAQRLALALLRGRKGMEAQAATIARESGGSPFFTRELARYLQDSPPAQTVHAVDLDAVVRSRLNALPVPALRLLEVVAVAGRPTNQEQILQVTETLAEGPPLLNRLKAEHLIRVTGAGQKTQLETYHDRIREATCRQLEPSARREIHGRLARAMEASFTTDERKFLEASETPSGGTRIGNEPAVGSPYWQRLFEVAFHYDAAGEPDQALRYSLAAAEQATRQHSLQIAVQQYRIAERGAAGRDPTTRRRVAEGLGAVLMLQGRYAEAKAALETARREATQTPPVVLARIQGKLGELAFKRGDLEAARASLEDALRLMRRGVPRSQAVCTLQLFKEIGVQLLHTWFPNRFVGRRRLDQAGDEFVVIRLYSRLAYVYWFVAGKTRCLWTHLRNLNLSEKYVPTSELAQAYAEHGPVMSLIPAFARAFRYNEKAIEIRRGLGDVWGQGPLLHYYGIVLYAASRFPLCIEKCQQAIELLDRTGDFWELNMARYQVAASRYRLGDLAGAYEEARKMHQSGLDLGDSQASGLAVDILSKAACGRVSREVLRAELERPRDADAQTASQVFQAEGVRLLAEGDFRGAAAAFQQGWETARRAGIKNTYVAPCLPWLATALRREAERCGEADPAASRRLLRQAQRAARRGLRLARKFQNDLPHCLRELGLLSATARRLRRARRFLDESLAVAAAQGARYERAQTALAQAELDVRENVPDSQGRLAQAQTALREILQACQAATG